MYRRKTISFRDCGYLWQRCEVNWPVVHVWNVGQLHRERQRQRQIDRQTDRQTDRWREKERDGKRKRERERKVVVVVNGL